MMRHKAQGERRRRVGYASRTFIKPGVVVGKWYAMRTLHDC